MNIKLKDSDKDYRIVIETAVSGKKWYYVQRRHRFMRFYWCAVKDYSDNGIRHKIGWSTMEEALAFIQLDINSRFNKEQNKIIERKIINII